MGADLIGMGWTYHPEVALNTEVLRATIDDIPDEELLANLLDSPHAGMEGWDEFCDSDELDALEGEDRTEAEKRNKEIIKEMREALFEGGSEISTGGGRCGTDFGIPDTDLIFVFAGGLSWGDDPFEGFSQMCFFTDYAHHWPTLMDAVGYVCGGLPSPAMLDRYRKDR